ncbi:PH domain-containing protein [Halovenus sp. WSH3]|uniref:PH domain-containing protein n=1 Tax=Halovenus carboxidivorans TaxID=2692199 RepID=A0A6B0TFI6_9EURY|nr:PH domain-containing protein [Halovenus carboxidivorans]
MLIDARPAWSAYAYYFVLAAVLFLGGLAAGNQATVLGIIAALAIVGYVWYKRRGIRYVVTDRRMMVVTGHSSKMTNEAWMVDIKNLKTGASFLERVLGHGHISVDSDITSAGFGRFSGMTFGGIDNHEQIAQIIRERQNSAKMD